MNTYITNQRIELVKAALGQIPFDLVIENVQIVNVYSEEIKPGAIGIKNGRIATLHVPQISSTKHRIDGNNQFAIPGFCDTHVHIDSSLLTPAGMIELVMPCGTTTLFTDPMEIANVAGIRGLKAFLNGTKSLPCHIFMEVPSRVPTAPGLETTGGVLDFNDVKKLLRLNSSVSLGELDPSKVLGFKEEYYGKINTALSMGKIANGHTAGLTSEELTAYACAGLSDDHECVTFEEAMQCLQSGLSVLIREGSTERNLDRLIRGIIEHKTDTRHWMFCTDDKHPNDIVNEGHIDFMVNRAIELGLLPIKAIQMASLNASSHFRMDHEIGSLAPGRWADIILTDSLQKIKPNRVFFKGRLVAEKGNVIKALGKSSYPEWLYQTVHITRGMNPNDYRMTARDPRAKIHVIEIVPDQIVNKDIISNLDVVDGNILTNVKEDILKLAVVERYGKNGNIGITFVKGFGLTKGAISSTVSHDHHNLIIVGVDDTSMATCARISQEIQGGFVAASGEKVITTLPLPLGGLLSDRSPTDIIKDLEKMNEAAWSLGSKLPAPFMSLSFISLPTVPELGLTDRGLIDVRNHCIISPIVE